MSRALCMCLLALCASMAAAQLAFPRPAQDCLSPALTDFVEERFFPNPYQIQSIAAPVESADKLSTTINVAEDFSVTYFSTFKVVTNKRNNETYLLYQCGTPNPATAKAGSIPGLPAVYKTFQIPLVATAVSDTTVNRFLADLNVTDRVAYAAGLSVSPCMQKISGCGNTTADAYDTSRTPTELQAAMTAQAAAADSLWTFGANASNPKSIAFSATADPGPLQRAEWIKFVAPFFNKELEANALYDKVVAEYNATKAAAAPKDDLAALVKPTVAWVAYSKYSGPGVVVYLTPYKSKFIEDAGGEPLTKEAVLNVPGIAPEKYSPETNFAINYTATPDANLTELLSGVDVIIDETYNLTGLAQWKQYFKLPADGRTGIPAVDDGKVYTITGSRGPLKNGVPGSYGNDWFESAVAHPELVLKDLVAAFDSDVVATNTTFLLALNDVTQPKVYNSSDCSAFGACAARSSPEAICPNVFRNCTTGLLQQAMPQHRCHSIVVCPANNNTVTPISGNGTKKDNAAWRPAAAGSWVAAVAGAATLAMLLVA